MQESSLRSNIHWIDGTKAPCRGTILLVEDYQPNILVATITLENLGFSVESVSSGLHALEKVKACKIPYTAILMDIRLYDMDGLETTRLIRALEKDKSFRQPIFGMTAHALSSDHSKCLEAGMDDYLSKPVNFEILARKLSGLHEGHHI